MTDLWSELYNLPENYLEYLEKIYEYHKRSVEFWRERNLEFIKDGLNELINTFKINLDLLREDWRKFLPASEKRIRAYQSSGTTGGRKFIYWSRNYLDFLVHFLKKYLDLTYRPRIRVAIIHGPYGWYQEENSELIWSYNGYLYFFGIETEGLKKILEKNPEKARELFSPLISNTIRILGGEEVDTIRTGIPLLDPLKPYLRNVKYIFISGTALTVNNYKELKKEFRGIEIIPLYGDFLFGDAIGIFEDDKLIYYPPYPSCLIFPVRMVGGRWEIVDYGERGKKAVIIARPDLFLISIDEKEEIGRERPRKHFKWDGFSNPIRVI